MIYFDITGNKGEGTMQSVYNIVENLLADKNTSHVFVIDDTLSFRYPNGEYRLRTISSHDELLKSLQENFEEKLIVLSAMSMLHVMECVRPQMFKIAPPNCHKKVYCIHLCNSI